ncbi:MAG: MalY/PatB family protein [Ilumatobacteraceae bacterium]
MTEEHGRFGGRRQGSDPDTLDRHFGTDDVVPLWIAEPSVELAPGVLRALEDRAAIGWYGYETRPASVVGSFWEWMRVRHGWDEAGLRTVVSPSVGSSIGVLIDQLTDVGDDVIIQPPVFTDFKTLIADSGRRVVRNPLQLTDSGYRIDLDGLARAASEPTTRLMILCSPHNPVGRVWTGDELRSVARICSDHDVFVIADEIHADLALAPHRFVPFASAAAGISDRWAATHGPINTFCLAGVCDTLMITGDAEVADRFEETSSRLHLTRNDVFGMAAFEAAYRTGAGWLDELLALVASNVAVVEQGLPDGIGLVAPEGTYLVWLDLRDLGLEVPEIASWLGAAGVALSPGHWFGREGAGFARLTVAAPPAIVEDAVARLAEAVRR